MKVVLKKNLSRFIVPSMVISVLSVFHNIIDGYFVGKYIGDTGLAAINLSIPIIAIITSIATGIGMGGGVVFSNKLADKDEESLSNIVGNTLSLLFISSILIITILLLSQDTILNFLGAEGAVFDLAYVYVTIITIGSFFQVISVGSNPLIRNNDKPIVAMIYILIGLFLNFILNYIFLKVLNLGLAGIGFATILGQSVSAILSLFNLFTDIDISISKKDLIPNRDLCKNILKLSITSFGSAYLPFAIIVFTNWQIIEYGETHALAAFIILSYVSQIVSAILQGVAYGAQPLISYYNGLEKQRVISQIKKITLALMVNLALGFMALAFLLRTSLPTWFGVSQGAYDIIKVDMIIASISYVPLALVTFTRSYFYAIEKSKYSNILVYLELIVIVPLLLKVLPLKFGLSGIWYTTPASQIILALIAICF